MAMKLKGIWSSPDDLFVFNCFSLDATSDADKTAQMAEWYRASVS